MGRPTALTETALARIDAAEKNGLSLKTTAKALNLAPNTVLKGRKLNARRKILSKYPLPEDPSTQEWLRECFQTGNTAAISARYPQHPERAFWFWYDMLLPTHSKKEHKHLWAARAFAANKTIPQIAQALDVTEATIRNWLRHDGTALLPGRKRGKPSHRPLQILLRENYGGIRDYIYLYRSQGVRRAHTLAPLVSGHFSFHIPSTTIQLIMYRMDVELGTTNRHKLRRAFHAADLVYLEGHTARRAATTLGVAPETLGNLLRLHCAWMAHYHQHSLLRLWHTHKQPNNPLQEYHKHLNPEIRP